MSKYYVVKVGREPGIYQSWGECKMQTDGYSGAIFKSFKSKKEAVRYFHGEPAKKGALGDSKEDAVDIYIDRSYDESLHLGGYGCVIVKASKVFKELSGIIKLTEHDTSRNIYGELRAAVEAVEWAIENKYKKVTLFYDYIGIKNWANGSWATNREVSREYAWKIAELKQSIKVEFEKVKAHSGDHLNERADELAKQVIQHHDNLRRRRPKSLWD